MSGDRQQEALVRGNDCYCVHDFACAPVIYSCLSAAMSTHACQYTVIADVKSSIATLKYYPVS